MPDLNLPLISIVLTTFNGEHFLQEQLNSLVAQTYTNIEMVVVDDNSTDQTPSILAAFAKKHPSIRLYMNSTNLGYIKNFEKACLLAKGEFIALCDQDDSWKPEKISRLYAAIGNFPLIYADSILCNEQLQPIGKNISDRVNCIHFTSPLQQAVFCRIYGHAMLINTLFLKNIAPFPSIIPHDWWIAFNATIQGGIQYLPLPLSFYRQHSKNIFGAAGGKRNKNLKRISQEAQNEIALKRMKLFYDYCPHNFTKEKLILLKLYHSYQKKGILNSLNRMFIFFGNYNNLLASKKRSTLRKWLFCLKTLVKMV